MKSFELREKFLSYFEELKHRRVPSSSLVPNNDPSVLLTTAGMQQFKPYFLGESDAQAVFSSRRLTSVQRCFRTSDIDNIGDDSHLTFFEMLGNFSIGDYSKAEAIPMAWKFLTEVVKLDKKTLWVTIFAGDEKSAKDLESYKLWSTLVDEKRISEAGRKDNWWGPPGSSGPCGPCSEIHTDLRKKPCERQDNCRPNCPCGRFLEVWNLVFMEFFQDEQGNFSPLPSKNIDTGLGLDRVLVAAQNKTSVFETDLFEPILNAILKSDGSLRTETEVEKTQRLRIIADHLKGATFLVADGVEFSNKEQGYILRRIFRRALDQLNYPLAAYPQIVDAVIELYRQPYPYLVKKRDDIHRQMKLEAVAYDELVNGVLKKIAASVERHRDRSTGAIPPLSATEAFNLYSTFGVSLDRLRRTGYQFDPVEVEKKIQTHKETSRAGQTGKFGGHGLGYSMNLGGYTSNDEQRVTRLHTATHLLHQALRTVLGKHVQQDGSDITPERLRFDFTHGEKITPEQRSAIEQLVNQQVQRDLSVTWEEVDLKSAIASGAMSFFKERYPNQVKVYTIGDFSKEICGGPHVKKTSEVGRFRIISEKSSSAGIRRIKATVE